MVSVLLEGDRNYSDVRSSSLYSVFNDKSCACGEQDTCDNNRAYQLYVKFVNALDILPFFRTVRMSRFY